MRESAGYAPLPGGDDDGDADSDEPVPAAKFNPNHDELGRFTFGDGDDSDNGTDYEPNGNNAIPSSNPTTTPINGQDNPQMIPATVTVPQNGRPDTFTPNNPNPPIPAYKLGFVEQADWNAFNQRLAQMQQSGEITPVEAFAYREIFAAEGGMHLPPPNSTAIAGITQPDLADIYQAADNGNSAAQILQGKLSGVEKTIDLKPGNVADIYQYYLSNSFHSVGGSAALNNVGNPYASAALADTMFRNGNTAGAGIVQNAINAVYADNGHAPIPVDDAMGPQTFAAYSSLARNSDTSDDLLDALASRRTNAVPDETNRFEHFAFVHERGRGI